MYGPRVPAIVASPYSKPNGVTNVVHDHTSVLATIEAKWNLPALTYRDANAETVMDFLNVKRKAFREPPDDRQTGAVPARTAARSRGRLMRFVGRRGSRLAASVFAFGLLAASAAATGPSADAAGATLPPIKHVWIIVLENQDYAGTFGNPSADPYLAKTLPSKGALLKNYYATGHESNDNYLAMVSGQPPNPDTQGDCQIYSAFPVGTIDHGIEAGIGCVYPSGIGNIGTQLTDHGHNWKAYQQDMGNDPKREAAACGHPAINQPTRPRGRGRRRLRDSARPIRVLRVGHR